MGIVSGAGSIDRPGEPAGGGLRALEVFVPPYVRWRLARDPAPREQAFEDVYPAAVVHVDIAGFTGLAEQFAAQGVAGAEQVSDMLNAFCHRLGETVAAHDGHPVTFAGDSVTAMWPVRRAADLPEAVCRALECAVALRDRIDGVAVASGASPLRVSVVLGAGDVRVAAAGGVDGRWLPFAYGDVFRQIWNAGRHAAAGEVVASDEAWRLVGPRASGEPLAAGAVRVSQVDRVDTYWPFDVARLPPGSEAALRAYLPRTVEARLDAGQTGWRGEFRHVTVAFIHVRALREALEAGPDAVPRVVRAVQVAVSTLGGSVNKAVAEREGLTFVAAWGVLLHAHENDAVRAVRAAEAVRRELQRQGVEVSIGIATGRIFCGPGGTDQHREHALLGDVVNVAARLAHEGSADIRCDGATRRDARASVVFKTLAPFRLRGRAAATAVYSPLSERPRRRGADVLIGREPEQRVLRRAIDTLESGGRGGVIFVDGEPGIGKSRLVADVIAETQQRAVQALLGWGDPLEQATPYRAWQGVFTRLMRLDTVSDRDRQRQQVLDALGSPERRAMVALTNVVLPFDFAETPETEDLRPAARARATRDLLVHLFRSASGSMPTLLVLEDANWIDSASYALAHDLVDRHGSLLVIFVTRPVVPALVSPDWRALMEAPSTVRLRLQALSDDEAVALACDRLDVDSLPPELADRILQVAEGHPFFTEQLVLAMRDREGVIRVEDGECTVVRPLSGVSFAETARSLVGSRIDGLNVEQQDTLKVAAVLGRRFDLWSLRSVHPANPGADDLQRQLDTLAELELLRVDDRTAGRVYSFKHMIAQEAVTGWLLPWERRNLNARVARLLEEQHPADLTPVHARLAHHWLEAGVVSKSLDYLELAARQALREDANQEAVQFLEQALNAGPVVSEEPGDGMRVRQAVWRRQAAEAYWVMGDVPRAKKYVGEAMSLLRRKSRSPGVELLSQLLVRAVQGALPQRLVAARDPARRAHLLEASRIAALSGILHAEPIDHVRALAGGLLSHNLAVRAGSGSVYALGMLGYLAGLAGASRAAGAYFARMRDQAWAQNDLRPLLFGLLLESMHLFGCGRVRDAEQSLQEGIEWAGRAGNQRDRARLLLLLGATTCFSGRMRPGLEYLKEAYQLAQYGDRSSLERTWSLISLAGGYAQHLPPEAAVELFHELRDKLQESVRRDTIDGMAANPLRVATSAALDALVYARAGRLEEAEAGARQALAFLASTPNLLIVHPSAWILFQGPLEALVRCWERAARERRDRAPAIARDARRFATALGRFAWLHPVYRPRALLIRGEVARMDGQLPRARAAWRRSLAEVDALVRAQGGGADESFMFDRALALCALGRAAEDPHQGARQLREALALFSQCEMPYFQRLAQAGLDALRPAPSGGGR